MHCVYVPHLLYPSIRGHTGWCHALAIINNVATKLGCISFRVIISFYSDKHPEVELLNCMVVQVLIF